MLSDGQSSRIYRKLVYEQAARAGRVRRRQPHRGSRTCSTPWPSCSRAQTPEEATKALIAELDRLKTEPISDRELQRAKNQFARDYILGRESNQEKALHLAHAAVIHDDITTADGEFDIFQNITAADVQRVARTYFTPENRLVLTLLPKGSGSGRELPQ